MNRVHFPVHLPSVGAAACAAAVLLAVSGGVAAQTVPVYTVGSDAACSHATLQAAIYAIPAGRSGIIRVTSAAAGYKSGRILIVDRSVHVSGGFDSCSDASADASRPALIEGTGSLPAVTVATQNNGIVPQVTLETLRVEKGGGSFGAGIRIGGRGQVRLSNVSVRHNTATQSGGGIHFNGSSGARLQLDYQTVLADNDGGLYGGGLYCVGGAVDFHRARIAGNIATAHGGGVFLDRCTLTGTVSGARAIVDNDVDYERHESGQVLLDGQEASGAGIYARNGSVLELGGASSTTLIADNVVRYQIHDGIGPHYTVDRGAGGGLLLAGASRARLVNTHIARNQASAGGGIRAVGNSTFELGRTNPGCLALPGYAGCASLVGNVAYGYDLGFTGCVSRAPNVAGHGGAIELSGGAQGILDGVRVTGNRVTQTDGCAYENHLRYPWGSAFMVGDGAGLDVFNTLVHGNGGTSADDIIHVHGTGARFRAFHSTIALNRSDVDATIRTSGATPRIGLFSTVLQEPSATLFANDGASSPFLRLDCVRASSLASLQAPSYALVTRSASGTTAFVDAAGDDFRLADGSAAIDRCDGSVMEEYASTGRVVYDLDGRRRPLFTGTDPARGWDLGALEKQVGHLTTLSDLEVTISDGGAVVPPDGTVSYLVTLRNHGPRAASNAGFALVVGEGLRGPADLLPLQPGWSCAQASGQVHCRFTGLLSGNGTPVQMEVLLGAPASDGETTSSVRTLLPPLVVDPVDGNNRASVSTTIGSFAPLVFADSFGQ